ncbi:MAG: aminoglycoside phosphotransferase family protein [Rickettsiales bacterium]|jgi:aminoglycoside phosphotransferase (APT) family kinase protein|nr:aminoglycoside phosphotransferase family protein [Rickettsiales bacterium]
MDINRVRSLFPSEKIEHIARGVKSDVFRTVSGKIIRVKPLLFGTYEKERRVLDFIKANGGIGCGTPSPSCFVRGLSAWSVHDDIRGVNPDSGEFAKLPPGAQKRFAKQLAESLVKFYRMGRAAKKSDIGKLLRRRDAFSFLRNLRRYMFIRKYVHKNGVWAKFSKLSRSVAPMGGGLVHGDLHARNIICGPDFSLAGIIDFDGAKFGHFEHNLRKLDPLLGDMVMDCLENIWNKKPNRSRLGYYRMISLIKKIKKAKDKTVSVRELESSF